MEKIYIADYNYPLPEERIAKYPLPQRDQSKLLVYQQGKIQQAQFFQIGNYLPSDSLLVYNNTRVIQARLVFHKEGTGARIEIFCLGPLQPLDYQLSLGSTSGCTWKCMIGNAKKWKTGPLQRQVTLTDGLTVTLTANRGEQTGNTFAIHFTWDNPLISFAQILDAMGELPIPPYLNRPTEESDKISYQTVYSRIKGSVAAPTAGLHFTEAVLQDIRQRGIETTEVTLHVGAGTFQPVKTEDANLHTMHTEIIAIPRETIARLQAKLGHIVAVGTTSMRTLESLYFLGMMLLEQREQWSHQVDMHVPQFIAYQPHEPLSAHHSMQVLLDYLDSTHQDTLHAETQIMIEPGYTFHMVDQLITNFHQPKSTLLLLVSAFVNGDWHTIYDYALNHDFRFLSYGDSSLLFRAQ